MGPGVHIMSDELILQITCNMFPAFIWILVMTPGQNMSPYTTAKLSINVWNHDVIWWQNKNDTQRHFHKTTITSSWTLSKRKIPIKTLKAQMPSNPNQKSRTRDNNGGMLVLRAALWIWFVQHTHNSFATQIMIYLDSKLNNQSDFSMRATGFSLLHW